MTITTTRLYDLLSIKVGKGTIEEKIKDQFADNTKILATKADMALVKEEIGHVRVNAASDKAEIIKWMFIFWVGQVIVTFGFILLFLKK